MRTAWIYLVLLVISLTVGQAAPARYLFGPDHRRPLTESEQIAFRPVGWVQAGEEGGTGALVGRGDLVVTSAHSFFRHGAPLADRFWFYPEGLDGPRFAIDRIWAGTKDPDRDRVENDWAIAKLAVDLGRTYGALSFARIPGALAEANHGKFLLVGFNTDTNVGHTKFVSPCSLHPRREEDALPGERFVWLHDCDTRAGASGAPIVLQGEDGDYYLVGLHSNHIYRPGTKDGDRYDPRFNTGTAIRFDGRLRDELLELLASP